MDVVAVAVLVATVILSQWCSSSDAALNAVDAAALFDLCDRPGKDLWVNCSDSANACVNSANWTGVDCNANKTAIVNMYSSPFDIPFSPPHVHASCASDPDSIKR